MSALGQKQTSRHLQPMSALPPKADIGTQPLNVRFVPKRTKCNAAKRALLDRLVGAGEQRRPPQRETAGSQIPLGRQATQQLYRVAHCGQYPQETLKVHA